MAIATPPRGPEPKTRFWGKVRNTSNGKHYSVSTIRNPLGIWEAAVFAGLGPFSTLRLRHAAFLVAPETPEGLHTRITALVEFQSPNQWIMDKRLVRAARRRALGLPSKDTAQLVDVGDSTHQAPNSMSNKRGALLRAGMTLTLLDLPVGFREKRNHSAAKNWFGVGANPNTCDEAVAVYRSPNRQTVLSCVRAFDNPVLSRIDFNSFALGSQEFFQEGSCRLRIGEDLRLCSLRHEYRDRKPPTLLLHWIEGPLHAMLIWQGKGAYSDDITEVAQKISRRFEQRGAEEDALESTIGHGELQPKDAPVYPYPLDRLAVWQALSVNIYWFSGEGMKSLRSWVEQNSPGKWRDQHNLLILTEVEFLLLYMLDATAFDSLGPGSRGRLMDFVVPMVLEATVDAMVRAPVGWTKSQASEASKTLEKVKASNLTDYNGRVASFVAFKKVIAAPGDDPSGTLFWEFADYLAQHFGYRNDPAAIAAVHLILLESVTRLKIPEALANLK